MNVRQHYLDRRNRKNKTCFTCSYVIHVSECDICCNVKTILIN